MIGGWPSLSRGRAIVLILALMGTILLPLGLWVFVRIEAWAKKTGKLKRTG